MTHHDTDTQSDASSEESSVTTKQWNVHCEDCDLDEEYEDEDDAVLRMVNHSNVADHTTGVKEVSA